MDGNVSTAYMSGDYGRFGVDRMYLNGVAAD